MAETKKKTIVSADDGKEVEAGSKKTNKKAANLLEILPACVLAL